MSDFKIVPTSDGRYDLAIENHDFVIIGDTEATWQEYVAQNITFIVNTHFGESSFDTSAGFPWLEAVFGVQPIEGVVTLLHDALLEAEGVSGLNEAPVIEFDPATQRLTITVQAAGEDFSSLKVTTEIATS